MGNCNSQSPNSKHSHNNTTNPTALGGTTTSNNTNGNNGHHSQQRATSDRPNGYSMNHSPHRDSHSANIHVVNPDIKVHTVVSAELDFDHEASMAIPLGEVTDEQLLAEVARRRLDLHDKITDAVVKETYDLGRSLGHGASGEVLLATHKVTGKTFACKIVKKNANMNDAQSMSTEIEIMKRIRHRNIVSMYELYETPKCLWIILELVDGGDLYHFLGHAPVYNEVIAARQMRQILQGVHYLHSLGVVHRDLKLENILLSQATGGVVGDIKIADFGLSALVRIDEDGYDAEESGKRKRYRQLKDMWGTKEYFAPEVIEQAYGPQADVWALGCVLYEMLVGEQAYPVREHDTESKFYGRIARGEFDTSRPGWKKVSADARNIVSSMLRLDPVDRLSASECLNHPWITGKCHTQEHMQPMPEVQESMRIRLEKKRRKAEAKGQQPH